MFAIIKTGGKQYLVHEGDVLDVEKLDVEDGSSIDFDALLVSDDEGKETKVGTPIVSGAKVSAKVVEGFKGEKIDIIKYKRKTGYRRKTGHRQPYTKLEITKIA